MRCSIYLNRRVFVMFQQNTCELDIELTRTGPRDSVLLRLHTCKNVICEAVYAYYVKETRRQAFKIKPHNKINIWKTVNICH